MRDATPKIVAVLFGLLVAMGAYWGKGVDERLDLIDALFIRLGSIEAKLDQLLAERK